MPTSAAAAAMMILLMLGVAVLLVELSWADDRPYAHTSVDGGGGVAYAHTAHTAALQTRGGGR